MQIFQKVKNGGMSICVSCAHRKVCKGIDNQPCVECNQFLNEDKKPQTNADRIRAMSDEELAKWLNSSGCICESCSHSAECVDPYNLSRCVCGVLEWLKQPAESEGVSVK